MPLMMPNNGSLVTPQWMLERLTKAHFVQHNIPIEEFGSPTRFVDTEPPSIKMTFKIGQRTELDVEYFQWTDTGGEVKWSPNHRDFPSLTPQEMDALVMGRSAPTIDGFFSNVKEIQTHRSEAHMTTMVVFVMKDNTSLGYNIADEVMMRAISIDSIPILPGKELKDKMPPMTIGDLRSAWFKQSGQLMQLPLNTPHIGTNAFKTATQQPDTPTTPVKKTKRVPKPHIKQRNRREFYE